MINELKKRTGEIEAIRATTRKTTRRVLWFWFAVLAVLALLVETASCRGYATGWLDFLQSSVFISFTTFLCLCIIRVRLWRSESKYENWWHGEYAKRLDAYIAAIENQTGRVEGDIKLLKEEIDLLKYFEPDRRVGTA